MMRASRLGLVWTLGLMLSATLVSQRIQPAETTDQDRQHWAFRPLRRVEPPAVQGVSSPIDRFLLAGLKQSGLVALPEADRLTLIRRVSYDLTGLPPTPDEIDGFLTDRTAMAYQRVVDRLLASRAYGERWAQLWLDLARFAETDGFEHDKVRPQAWRYRDWVIAAFQRDLPFDQFVQLQIAGDELKPGDRDAAVATGFLLAGPDMPDINSQVERRDTKLNEITSTVGTVFLGLTVGCAQCHDHKFDPISQADFYALRAVFSNAVWPKRNKSLPSVIREPRAEAPAEHIRVRGHFARRGPRVEPAFLPIFNQHPTIAFEPASVPKSSGRRSSLAKWLTRPDHPLVTRVIVNWLWQYHFGRGLVTTPSDFGKQGRPPSHPELLDWLATELPRRGFSLKEMHKLMVSTAAYRRGSLSRGQDPRWRRGVAIDPQNILLWRANRQRLQGEAIRDAMLWAAGRLSDRRGGPGVRPPLPVEITGTLLRGQWKVTPDYADHDRRSVYLFARRNLQFPIFSAFDRPDANASCARREQSTTAPQSLILLNSKFSLDSARRLAGFVLARATDPQARVRLVYRRTLSRYPNRAELAAGAQFLKSQAEMLRGERRSKKQLARPDPMPDGVDVHTAAALVDFCLAMFNLNEFVYID